MSIQTRTLWLGPEDDGRLIDADEFARAETVEPFRYERWKGRLVVMSPNNIEHNYCVGPIHERLSVYKVTHPEVIELIASEAWFAIDADTDRISDVAVFLRDERGRRVQKGQVPDLAFEVISEGSKSHVRDYVEKVEDYGDAGVAEYVIVDRFRRAFTIYRSPFTEDTALTLQDDAIYETPLLPGLAIPLIEIFGPTAHNEPDV